MKTQTKSPRSKKNHADMLRAAAIIPEGAEQPVLQANRYSVRAVEGMLARIEERATHRVLEKGKQILEWVKDAREAIHTDDWLKTKGEVAMAAARGDAEAIQLHAAAVVITTNNFVAANSSWEPFFESRTLQPDEYPAILPERKGQGITIEVIGQDGGNIMRQAATTDPTPVFLPLITRATPWIEYPLQDLYTGSVKEAALAQFDIARDKAIRRDQLLGSYLVVNGANTRLVSAFTTSGDVLKRDYWAEPNANVANFPAGNLITLTGNSTSSLFRKEAFDAILKYCGQWGDGVLEGGASLVPVEIQIASSHMTDFLAQVSLSSVSNKLNDQIFDGGIVMNYGGRNWVIVGNNTLDPNQGMAYVRTNLPIGIDHSKPNFENVLVDESPELTRQNKGRTCETWVECFAMPLHWRKRTVGIRYRTPV